MKLAPNWHRSYALYAALTGVVVFGGMEVWRGATVEAVTGQVVLAMVMVLRAIPQDPQDAPDPPGSPGGNPPFPPAA